jgi:uncharacterized protein (DUF362 family)
MAKSVVSIAKGTDVEALVQRAIDLAGGIGSIMRPGATVVIKPNAGHLGVPGSSVNTTPEVVTAVINAVKKANPGKIILAESSAVGCDTMECLEVSGIRKAAEDAGVDDIRDIKSDPDLVRVRVPEPSSLIKHFDLPRFLLDADNLINVPVFKCHVSMVFTCAMKNLKGVVQDHSHYVMHTTNLAGAMMDLGDLLQDKTFTMADLYRPMEGFGPHAGTPVEFDCIVAGKDLVAVDATACRMVGLPLEKVEYFDAALEKGLGRFAEAHIEIRGEAIDDVKRQLYIPYLDGFGAFPEYDFHVKAACSTCQGLTAFTMSKLKALGEYDKNAGAHVVLGRHKDTPEELLDGEPVFLMGDCTLTLKKRLDEAGVTSFYVHGCPPPEPTLGWAIVDRVEMTELSAEDHKNLGPVLRKRLEYEEVLFKDWMAKQARS